MRGVDFTGCDFTGVNIFELDLSECVISPAQIEQAIGHIPTALELKKLLSPKNKKRKPAMKGIDFEDFFTGGNKSLDLDTTNMGINVHNIGKKGKEVSKSFHKRDSDEKIIEKFNNKSERKESNVEELRKTIEQHKKEVLERRQEEQEMENKEKMREQIREKIKENKAMLMQVHSSRER